MNPLILKLVQMLFSAGVEEFKVWKTLRDHGEDPVAYEAAVKDTRTFEDFHGKNPRGTEPIFVPPNEPVPGTDVTVKHYDKKEDAIVVAQNTPGYGVFLLQDGKFEVFPLSIGPAPGERVWPA